MSRSGYDVTPLTKEQREQAAAGLNNMAKYITLEHGTERAFTGVGAEASHCMVAG